MIKTILHHLSNLPGWRTNRKIVVFESDDWGSIRMPSKEVYDKLLKAGIRVDKCPYNTFDSLASEDDLSALFEVLSSVKDKNRNPAMLTANTIVANPDFDKIHASGFQQYFYEPFTETLKKYPKHAKSFELWKEGMEKGIFVPQFHGREHLNVLRWLRMLRRKAPETRIAFDNQVFGISTTITNEQRRSYMAALDIDNISDIEWQKEMLADGLDLFKRIFKYHSSSFIATNYVWGNEHEKVLAQNSIKYIQGAGAQKQPTENGFRIKRHYMGQKNKLNQFYLRRNVLFEPSLFGNKDWVTDTIKDINIAFFWKKPAIISAHRLNFIGSINEKNRSNNLKAFRNLLKTIVNKWPEVEFLSTDKLGLLISNKNKYAQ